MHAWMYVRMYVNLYVYTLQTSNIKATSPHNRGWNAGCLDDWYSVLCLDNRAADRSLSPRERERGRGRVFYVLCSMLHVNLSSVPMPGMTSRLFLQAPMARTIIASRSHTPES